MIIDCDTCMARDVACRDCVITVLLKRPPLPVDFDEAEQLALGSLAGVGLVPPLRLLPDLSGKILGIA